MTGKKICLLGAFAVGKTSLVERFVKGNFMERYHTTVGVKIDWKIVRVADQEIKLIIWDVAGEDEFQKVKMSNLAGCHGYLLVADGTRAATIETAYQVQDRVIEAAGAVPFAFVLNKVDLTDEWEVDDGTVAGLVDRGWDVVRSSAKTGAGVEEAFALISHKIVEK